MSRLLSKSRFKEALECMTKLYYTGKKNEYADTNLSDPFLEALAKGGFQVGELAKYYFIDNPVQENITIDSLDLDYALAETERRLAQSGRVVIAEAAFKYNNLIIRADIVVKENDTLYLYEVKAKSIGEEANDTNSFLNAKNDRVNTDWTPYLYDLAFQKYVIKHCDFSRQYSIKAHLMLIDKTVACDVDALNQKFKIIKDGNYFDVIAPEGLTRADLGREIMIKINLDEIIDRIWYEFVVPCDLPENYSFEDFVFKAADIYANDERVYAPISKKCKSCRYFNDSKDNNLKSGFHECWKNHTDYSDELLDSPLVTELWGGKAGNVSHVDKAIKSNIFLLENINEEIIKSSSSKKSESGLTPYDRRVLQINKVKDKDDSCYFDAEGMKMEMDNWKYPLHMIDFETSMVALPFHSGKKPYEGIAFQFSHHIINEDGSVIHKGQFLQIEPGVYPNYNFIRALKNELANDNGTIFRYHNHENSYLNMIASQLENNADAPEDSLELIEFIRSITQRTINNVLQCGERNMVDLYELVLRYYYSPKAKGSNSLKQILPAIINDSEYLRAKYSVAGKYGKNLEIKSLNFDDHIWIRNDKANDPYKTLPAVFDNYDRETLDELVKDFDEVSDGGAALTAYNYIQYSEVPEDQRNRIAEALLRYCELDTLAMVMIVEGWRDLLKVK